MRSVEGNPLGKKRPQTLGHQFGAALRLGGVTVACEQPCQPHRRGIAGTAPERQFPLCERPIVVGSSQLDGIVLRVVGLQNDLPSQNAAPGTPGHLGQRLKGPLSRAKSGRFRPYRRRQCRRR